MQKAKGRAKGRGEDKGWRPPISTGVRLHTSNPAPHGNNSSRLEPLGPRQERGEIANISSNFDFTFSNIGHTNSRGRGSNRARGRASRGRCQESKHRFPYEQHSQYPSQLPPHIEHTEPTRPRSLSDSDISPTAPFFTPQKQPPREPRKQQSNRPLPAPRRRNHSGNGHTYFGDAGDRGYESDRPGPTPSKKWLLDENQARYPLVTAEEVLLQHFADFNRHPPYLTGTEYRAFFDQARKEFDPFGVAITLKDVYTILKEKTFFELVLTAKREKLGQAEQAASSPDDISLPDIPLASFADIGLNFESICVGENPTPIPPQFTHPSSSFANSPTNTPLRMVNQTASGQDRKQTASFPVQLISHLTPKALISTTPFQPTMATPTIDNFLSEISLILRQQDGAKLQSFLLIEPEFPIIYNTMISELRYTFSPGTEIKLEAKCSQALPEAREGIDGSPWTAFIKFTVQYFTFLRDVNVEDLLKTYNQLSELVQKCNSALVHHSLGMIILPTVVTYSKVLTRLAIGLEKRPDLMIGTAKVDESGERITLPERAANMMRNAFVTCLNDRSGGPSGVQDGRPAGKKVGIYKIANLCLKILFQCGKSHNSQTIFNNIHKQSPPLSIYPRSERVTYLYYLGSFHFTMSHFYRAQLALQAAYDECPRYSSCEGQRRLILIYLITSNILLGRFPSEELYQKPEAHGFRERFQPLCRAIAKGDLETFRRLTDDKHKYHKWFWHYCIQLQLKHRCEVLVWRSLARKTFMLNGVMGDPANKIAPTFQIEDFAAVLRRLEIRAMYPMRAADTGAGNRHTNWVFMPEEPPQSAIYIHPEFEGVVNIEDVEDPWLLPDASEAECIVASLVHQGFLNGFISHRLLRFAIQGARTKPALQAGFPRVWDVIKARYDDEVPGWKRNVGGGVGFVDGDGPRNAGMPVGFI